MEGGEKSGIPDREEKKDSEREMARTFLPEIDLLTGAEIRGMRRAIQKGNSAEAATIPPIC